MHGLLVEHCFELSHLFSLLLLLLHVLLSSCHTYIYELSVVTVLVQVYDQATRGFELLGTIGDKADIHFW